MVDKVNSKYDSEVYDSGAICYRGVSSFIAVSQESKSIKQAICMKASKCKGSKWRKQIESGFYYVLYVRQRKVRKQISKQLDAKYRSKGDDSSGRRKERFNLEGVVLVFPAWNESFLMLMFVISIHARGAFVIRPRCLQLDRLRSEVGGSIWL